MGSLRFQHCLQLSVGCSELLHSQTDLENKRLRKATSMLWRECLVLEILRHPKKKKGIGTVYSASTKQCLRIACPFFMVTCLSRPVRFGLVISEQFEQRPIG